MSAASELLSAPFTWNLRAKHALHRSWFPVARGVDLVQPHSATLLGRDLVVYRTASGRAVVQDARCSHRGASLVLGKVVGERIACPYHGWQYEAMQGRCVHIPSLDDQGKIHPKARVRTYPSLERFGHVWTVLEDPVTELYDPAGWRGVDYEWLAGEMLESPTGVAIAIENFADVSHFAFIHTGMMGDTPPQIEALKVRREGLDVWMDRPLGACSGAWAKDGPCMMRYHIVAPGFIAITYDYERLGRRIVAGFPSPVAYDQVRIFWGVANERGYRGADLAECLKIEDFLYREDLPIAATIEPHEVDWDGHALEYSVPADLYTLSYRHAFKEFIERAGQGRA